ncbi:MAG: acetoacetate--CoA ligase [Leptospiraceae bacterium]|nr:acetoacetate--CoA ligase [Leptospiraceae bacterium]
MKSAGQKTTLSEHQILWQPAADACASTQLKSFMEFVRQFGWEGQDYAALHEWSVARPATFWQAFVSFSGICFQEPATQVFQAANSMRNCRWFVGARFNMAANLLRHKTEKEALVFYSEAECRSRWTYTELGRAVARWQAALLALGLKPGDHVAALMPNIPETVIAMLATTAIGAVWSSCSPDFGVRAVIDRFGQIKPRILIACEGYVFKGRFITGHELNHNVCAGLEDLQALVTVPYPGGQFGRQGSDGDVDGLLPGQRAASATAAGRYLDLNLEAFLAQGARNHELYFESLPFDHPVYIMYSSGTTGKPKCLVQGPGVLVNHVKEHVLHGDLRPDDTIFYFTTCGWMMWNWLISALFVGSRIVLFDGNPLYPGPDVLWRMAAAESVSIFGTSPKYLEALATSGTDLQSYALESLQVLLSTGAPLAREQFEFVYKNIKADLRLSSIAGGTDINGCFGIGNPVLPVRAGELQCKALAMDVRVRDEQGRIQMLGNGELVCMHSSPSMPLFFLNDADGSKYRAAYFEDDDTIWVHGDFITIHPHGGLEFLGRSDATLNPGGIRIGTADLYSALADLNWIQDSVAIAQPWQSDVRVVLFVVLTDSSRHLSAADVATIQKHIRQVLSPRHVPAKVLSVSGIPYTRNGKKVELAIRKAVLGEPISNRSAMDRPELLDEFMNRPELSQAPATGRAGCK